MKNLHVLLLSLYLFLVGIFSLIGVSFPILHMLLSALGIGAGVFIIINGKSGVVNFLNSILLAIFLLLSGIITLFGVLFDGSGLVVGALAIVTGVLIIIDNKKKKVKDFLGGFLLAIWLLLVGLVAVIGLSFTFLPQIIAIAAIVASVFIYITHK